jgi:hypothetical protein
MIAASLDNAAATKRAFSRLVENYLLVIESGPEVPDDGESN